MGHKARRRRLPSAVVGEKALALAVSATSSQNAATPAAGVVDGRRLQQPGQTVLMTWRYNAEGQQGRLVAPGINSNC